MCTNYCVTILLLNCVRAQQSTPEQHQPTTSASQSGNAEGMRNSVQLQTQNVNSGNGLRA